MNKDLQRYMNSRYRGSIQLPSNQRGSSSINETQQFRSDLVEMLKRNRIKSIFDSGCNDSYFGATMANEIEYHGGDIALGLIAEAWEYNPNLDIIVHDCTTDPYPAVDCVFIRDVTIHLSTEDQTRFIQNWKNSGIPWLAVSHNSSIDTNTDFTYQSNKFGHRETNWQLDPWNWPAPTDSVAEVNSTKHRQIALWHRNQI